MIQELIEAVKGMFTAAAPGTLKPEVIESPDFDGQVTAVREGYKLQTLPAMRRRQRRHTFHSLGSLAAWLRTHQPDGATAGVEILVAGDRNRVDVLLDPPNPGGDHVTCRLVHHPIWEAWSSLFESNTAIDQKLLHRFVRTRLADFVVPEPEKGPDGSVAAEVLHPGEFIAGELRKLQVARIGEISTEIDERGFSAFRGDSDRLAVSGKLPPSFRIRIPVYVDVGVAPFSAAARSAGADASALASYELEIYLTMDVDENKKQVLFRLLCPELPLVRQRAVVDAAMYLELLLGESFLVGLGEAETADVADLPRPLHVGGRFDQLVGTLEETSGDRKIP